MAAADVRAADDAQTQQRPAVRGHVLALVTVLVWAVTFVSTKVLLVHLAPHRDPVLPLHDRLRRAPPCCARASCACGGSRRSAWFMLAGATGVTLYYLLENIALTFTTASIVGVVVAAAPLFTGIASAVVLKERLRAPFFAGFAVAMAGVCLVSFSGGTAGLTGEGGLGQTGLVGVALALAAAGTWAAYSIVTKKLSTFGYDSILVTRRTFAWGLAFMLPTLPVLGFSPDWASLAAPEMWGNLVFLGLGASAPVLRDVEHGGEGAGAREDEPVHLPRARAHRAGLGGRAGRSAHAARHRRPWP